MAQNQPITTLSQQIPSGYVIGRESSGDGSAELIPIQDIMSGTLAQKGRMYQLGFSWPGGVPGNSQRIGDHCFSIGVTFPPSFTAYQGHVSQGVASAASTGTATFAVNKNGSGIGTIVFTGAATATFTTTSSLAQKFAQGDILTIVAPASADATLANPAFTLVGYES